MSTPAPPVAGPRSDLRPGRRIGRPSTQVVLSIAVALLIVMGGVGTVTWLQVHAGHSDEALHLVAELTADAHWVDTLGWESLARPDAREAVLAEHARVEVDYSAVLADLSRVHVRQGEIQRLRRDFVVFDQLTDRVISLTTEQPDAARLMAVGPADAAFENLARDLDRVTNDLSSSATATRLWSTLGSGATVVLLIVAFILMTVRLDRLQRRNLLRRVRTDAEERQERRLRALIHGSADLLAVVDADGRLVYASPAVRRIAGGAVGCAALAFVQELILPDDRAGFDAALRDVAKLGGRSRIEVGLIAPDGVRVFELLLTDHRNDPDTAGIVCNGRDVTERRRLEKRLRSQAHHDPLTGLGNREKFSTAVKDAYARQRDTDAYIALLFIDLDDFKAVNDSLGHHAGDQLLVAVGRRLSTAVRPGDTVARLGGDEFAVLIEGSDGTDVPVHIATRILSLLRDPVMVGGHPVMVTASIGMVDSADGPQCPDELLIHADIAMYMAKSRGKNRFERFEASMGDVALRKASLRSDLPVALKARQFVVYYQPVVELDSGRPVGAEALVRWLHPACGIVGPDEFIPLAEDSGLIIDIGRWVLAEACRQLAEWRGAGVVDEHFKITVNLSARQFEDDGLLAFVEATLVQLELPPDRLVLEVTETTVARDHAAAARVLWRIRGAGIGIAIDDFGTGESALSKLHALPVDMLKLDRSFLADLGDDVATAQLVRGIIELGRSLGLSVLAEGVETAEQAEFLATVGCDLAQGFLFARPLSAPDAGGYLREAIGAPREGTRADSGPRGAAPKLGGGLSPGALTR